jgi:hypothetical protein
VIAATVVASLHLGLAALLTRSDIRENVPEPPAISVELLGRSAGAATRQAPSPDQDVPTTEVSASHALPPPAPVVVTEAAPAATPTDVLAHVQDLVGVTPPSTPALSPAATFTPTAAVPDECAVELMHKLQSDSRLFDHLAVLPRDARSVANAVMLWDGGWVAARSADAEPAMAGVRASMRAAASGASEACRLKVQTGPKLLTLSSGEGATVLVVGSGTWRLSDLLATPDSAETRRLDVTPHF